MIFCSTGHWKAKPEDSGVLFNSIVIAFFSFLQMLQRPCWAAHLSLGRRLCLNLGLFCKLRGKFVCSARACQSVSFLRPSYMPLARWIDSCKPSLKIPWKIYSSYTRSQQSSSNLRSSDYSSNILFGSSAVPCDTQYHGHLLRLRHPWHTSLKCISKSPSMRWVPFPHGTYGTCMIARSAHSKLICPVSSWRSGTETLPHFHGYGL